MEICQTAYEEGLQMKLPGLLQVAFYESSFNPNAKGQAGEVGVFQFKPATFAWFSKKSGIAGSVSSTRDQFILTEWAFRNGYGYHWSTAKLIN